MPASRILALLLALLAAGPAACSRQEPPQTYVLKGQVLMVPVSHGEGNYQADALTIAMLEDTRRVVFRYVTPEGEVSADGNPNGSLNNIAGIINERGNVLGVIE